ncbi:MAG: 5-nucleotide phosphatase [Rhodospirillaceae bacterium]|nr:5-nucleotide phosphatase [Rhodospirillaceae bacterium]
MKFGTFTLALACALSSGLAAAQETTPEPPVAHEDRLNAILWQMSSAEYEGAARTAYLAARLALDDALKDKTRTAAPEQTGDVSKLPPAIIMDIDETVLDNGPVQVHMLLDAKTRPGELMSHWFDRAVAKPTPGAVEFIQYAQSKGVMIFFISNRNADKEAATRRNLEAVGVKLPADIDTVLLEKERPEWQRDKGLRRAEVVKTHRVLMLVGDDFGDFVSAWNKPSPERRAVAAEHSARWGRDWIMLPNPMYGSWENAAINFNFRATPAERLRIKRDTLKAFDSGE